MDCTAVTCIPKDEMNKTLDTNCVLIAVDTFLVGGVTNMVHTTTIRLSSLTL